MRNNSEARSATVYLDFIDNLDSAVQVKLDLDIFFTTNRSGSFDYTIVAIAASDMDKVINRTCQKFYDSSNGVNRFEGLNVISYPIGNPQTYSIRGLNYLETNSKLVHTENLQILIRHEAYTLPGSSGAIGFDDRWKPISLHCKKGDVVKDSVENTLKVDSNAAQGYSVYKKGTDYIDDVLYRSNVAIAMEEIALVLKQNLGLTNFCLCFFRNLNPESFFTIRVTFQYLDRSLIVLMCFCY